MRVSSSVLEPEISSSCCRAFRGLEVLSSPMMTVVSVLARPNSSILNVTDVLGLNFAVSGIEDKFCSFAGDIFCSVLTLAVPALYRPFPAKFGGGCSSFIDVFVLGAFFCTSLAALLTDGRFIFEGEGMRDGKGLLGIAITGGMLPLILSVLLGFIFCFRSSEPGWKGEPRVLKLGMEFVSAIPLLIGLCAWFCEKADIFWFELDGLGAKVGGLAINGLCLGCTVAACCCCV